MTLDSSIRLMLGTVIGRSILLERKVEIYHTEFDDFKTELERRNLHKRLTNLADGTIDVALVKEFYANLYSSRILHHSKPELEATW